MKLSRWFTDGVLYDEMDAPGTLRAAGGALKPDSKVVAYARAVALCNTVVPQEGSSGGQIEYDSDSPDELALMEGLRQNEVFMTARTQKEVTISIFGQEEST